VASYAVTVTVDDGWGGADSVSFTWTVTAPGGGLVIDYPDFVDVSDWQLNGAAVAADGVLRLTPAVLDAAGSAFYATPLSLTAEGSFASRFDFRVHGTADGGDGLTFMLQGSGVDSLGAAGNGLGYEGIGASLAVEIDNHRKWNGTDPDGNHLAVLTQGDVSAHLLTYTPAFDLEDGATHTLWVEYDGASERLVVYLSQTPGVKPASPVLSVTVDLPALLGPAAYVGFSAGTGGRANNHDIENWSLFIP
jgi:hypothetical protein